MEPKAKIFAVRGSMPLAKKIAQSYGQELGQVSIIEFSDGEFQPSFEETVRGGRVFIIGSTFQPDTNLMELLLLCDAAKRASAKHITVVMPYFGWARQDRKDKSRVPIGAKLIANLLRSAGATRIMTMDLHADQIQGFFEMPVDHLFVSSLFVPHIQQQNMEKLTIGSPDVGGSKRANNYAKKLGCEMVICYKERKKANVVENMKVIGDVKDRNVILVDDLIDTAGTLTKAADMLMEEGAKSVRAYCTHPVLSGSAYERIEDSQLTELVVSDSIPLKKESPKIKVISVAEHFARVMWNAHHHVSFSSNFIM